MKSLDLRADLVAHLAERLEPRRLRPPGGRRFQERPEEPHGLAREDRVREVVADVRAAGFPAAEASAGLAAYLADADSALELVRLADERMYQDKRLHRAAGAPPGEAVGGALRLGADLRLGATSEHVIDEAAGDRVGRLRAAHFGRSPRCGPGSTADLTSRHGVAVGLARRRGSHPPGLVGLRDC
jgi:hypothetical protein